MPTIKVRVDRYFRPYETRFVEVPALIRGDVAVHRPVHWFNGGEPEPSGRGWAVTHIPTGSSLNRALPDRLKGRGATRRDLAAWAAAFQAAIPEFFDAHRLGAIPTDPTPADRELGLRAMNAGQGL